MRQGAKIKIISGFRICGCRRPTVGSLPKVGTLEVEEENLKMGV